MSITQALRRPPWLYALALLGVALVGLLDYVTGPEISFSIFYLAPVAMVAMSGRSRPAIGVAFAGAGTWLFTEKLSHTYSHWAIAYWNAFVRLGFFVIVALALARLRLYADRAQALAATDPLTGLANRRVFFSTLRLETARMARAGRPLTVAYLDVDDFKQVNDRLGHHAGDALLSCCGRVLTREVRATDTVARLGGDEFAVLLPETHLEAAKTLLARVHDALGRESLEGRYRVTFSIGAVNVSVPAPSVEAIIKRADEVMYRIKKTGKNGLSVESMSGEARADPAVASPEVEASAS